MICLFSLQLRPKGWPRFLHTCYCGPLHCVLKWVLCGRLYGNKMEQRTGRNAWRGRLSSIKTTKILWRLIQTSLMLFYFDFPINVCVKPSSTHSECPVQPFIIPQISYRQKRNKPISRAPKNLKNLKVQGNFDEEIIG